MRDYTFCHQSGPMTHLLLVFEIFLIFILVSVELFCKPKGTENESNSDYFSQLSFLQQRMWLAYETYYRKELDIALLSDSAFTKLKKAKCTGRLDTSYNCFNYNILQNLDYLRLFGVNNLKTEDDFF